MLRVENEHIRIPSARSEEFFADKHKKLFEVRVVVNNAVYVWNDVTIKKDAQE